MRLGPGAKVRKMPSGLGVSRTNTGARAAKALLREQANAVAEMCSRGRKTAVDVAVKTKMHAGPPALVGCARMCAVGRGSVALAEWSVLGVRRFFVMTVVLALLTAPPAPAVTPPAIDPAAVPPD